MLTAGQLSSVRLGFPFSSTNSGTLTGNLQEQPLAVDPRRRVTAPGVELPPPLFQAQALDVRRIGTTSPPPNNRQRAVSPIPASPMMNQRHRAMSPIPVSPQAYGALPPEPPRAFFMPFPVGDAARGRSKSPFQGGPRLAGASYSSPAGTPAYPLQARSASVEIGNGGTPAYPLQPRGASAESRDGVARLHGSCGYPVGMPAFPAQRRGASVEYRPGRQSLLSPSQLEAPDGGSVRLVRGSSGSFGYPASSSALTPQRRAVSAEGVGLRAGHANVEKPLRPAPGIMHAAPRLSTPPRRIFNQLPTIPSVNCLHGAGSASALRASHGGGSVSAPVSTTSLLAAPPSAGSGSVSAPVNAGAPRTMRRVASPTPAPVPESSAGATSSIADQFSKREVTEMIERINSLLQDTAENRNMLKTRVVQCFKKAAAMVGEDLTDLREVGLDLDSLQTFRDLLLANIGMPPSVFGDLEAEYVRFDFDGTGKLKVNAAYKLVKFHLSEFRKELGGAPDTIAIPFKSMQVAGYTITKELGHGNQGTAKLATDATGENFCIKCYKKEKMLVGGVEELNSEYEALRLLHCDVIAGVFEMFQDSHFYYMVGEPYYGGDFLTLKHRARVQGIEMTENWWRKIFRQCFEALAFMHEQAMIHCDIKEPNMMLKTNDFLEPQVVVIDLGVAKAMAASDKSIPHGTPGYVPPEVLETKKWWPKGDIFSMGVCIMQIMTDKLPPSGPRTKDTPGGIFMEGCESIMEIFQMTCKREPPFELMPEEFPGLTMLVTNLLRKSQHERPRALQVLLDPWFADYRSPRSKRASSMMYNVHPRSRFATIGIRGSFLSNFIDGAEGSEIDFGRQSSSTSSPMSKTQTIKTPVNVPLPIVEDTSIEEPPLDEIRMSTSRLDGQQLQEDDLKDKPKEPAPCLRHEKVLTHSTLEEAPDEEAPAVEAPAKRFVPMRMPGSTSVHFGAVTSESSVKAGSASLQLLNGLSGSASVPFGAAASERPAWAPVTGAVPMPVWSSSVPGLDVAHLPDQPREPPIVRPVPVPWNPPQLSQLLATGDSLAFPRAQRSGSLEHRRPFARAPGPSRMSVPVARPAKLPDAPQFPSIRVARVIETTAAENARPLTARGGLLRREVAVVNTTSGQISAEGEQSV